MAVVWVGFLALPLILLHTGHVEPWRRVAGSAGIIGFTLTYTWATFLMVDTRSADQPDLASPGWSALRGPALSRLVLLMVFTGLTTAATGWLAAYLFPFFCAFLLYISPLVPVLPGICLVMVAIGVLDAAILTWAPSPYARWMALGCCAGGVIIILSRLSMESSRRQAQADRHLAAATEREEISRDVHDILGHSLTLLTLKAEVAHRLLAHDPQAAERELAQVIELSRAALADVRTTVSRLRTPDLASQLASSRSAFAAADLTVAVSGSASSVPLPQRELVAWTLREATTNILRHARATRVSIQLAPGLVRVTDDGQGLGGAPMGNGLLGLHRRVEAAGGRLVLTSPAPASVATPDRGTAVAAGGRPGTCLEVRL
ncbi:two-component sensor histidine kinase [Actinomyces lilanjuaniae]|uniref:Two-component sensor histidine kinase n=1 Tax=Actinomyces lilanjuaniae TaxID=2321394 RepID=A0ABN5PPG4_9ACTO|nr:histidine kinase [Actinomyces lilanjuaniae]AYD89538.1 two-component sensor histidine kinase [Actinomyces lilanjuaniae]